MAIDRTPGTTDPATPSEAGPDRLVVGDLVIDLRGREARLEGVAVPLTRIEFDLVAYLAAHPGWVVSPDQLMEEVWGYRSLGDTRAVSVHIGNVRRKLGDSTEDPRYIQTVRGAGYKLVNPTVAPPVPVAAVDPTVASTAATGDVAAGTAAADVPVRQDGLVGRERELAELTEAWNDARRGHGGFVLLSGDAGIGKTRLAEELAARARAGGGAVAWGRCHDAEGLPAYWPWIQMLRHLIESSPDDELLLDTQSGAMELSAMIPELRQRVSDAATDEPCGGRTNRERFFRSVIDYLVWSSLRRPLLLVLDDLHVADPSSFILLRALAPEIPAAALLVVATYRDTELGHDHPLTESLAALDHSRCRRIPIAGLTAGDVERIMNESTGLPVAPSLAQAIHEQTAGNPLFVVELTRLLAVEGRLSGGESGKIEALPLPQGVRSVLERHIARLSPGCRDLLALAALMGRSIDLLVLSGSSGLSGEPLLRLLDEAIAARLLERDAGSGRFHFVHPLVREALAIDRGEGERLRLHARIGETLESHSLADPEAYLPDLAYHFSRAAPLGYGPRAYDYCRRAGAGALSRFGYEEAAEHYSRALTLLPCSDLDVSDQRTQAMELHEAIGDALSLAPQRREAIQAYQRAAMLLPPDDRVTRARLERKTGAAWLADQEPARALVCLESAVATLGPAWPAEPAPADPTWVAEKIEIALQCLAAYYFSGDLEALSSLVEESGALVERSGTGEQRGIFAAHYLALAFRQERYRVSPATVAYAREHWGRLHRSGDGFLACEAEYQLGFALLWAGELDEAQRHLLHCAELADAARDHSHLVRALTYLTVVHRLRGEVEPARAAAERAIHQATLAHLPGYVAAGKATLAWVALRDGDAVAAEDHAREALDLWKAPSAFPFEWLARWPLAAVALAADPPRLTEAAQQLVHMLDPGQQLLPERLAAVLAAAVDEATTVAPETLLRDLQTARREAAALNYC